MELVQAFNAELSTLYESKPPISKGKMNTITKTAIKAIKMYKHIVQSVERFIAKCRPEYKVPGLYVIDSIVRQSRHQFGYDKDVFGPRFTRNFNQTFQNLFLACPLEDKPKIVRVLNLWQRNNVFSCDVIQPLLDMANPNAELKSNTPSDEQASLKDTQDKNIVMQLNQLASSLISKNANGSNLNTSSLNNDNTIHRFNKKLLEFDYGDDDEDDTPTESELPLSTTLTAITNSDELNANPLALSMAQNLLSNPDLVQKLQQSLTMQSDSVGIGKMIDNLDIANSSFCNLSNANNMNADLSVVEQLFNLRDSLKLVSNQQNVSSNNHQFNQLNSKLEKRDYDNKQDSKRRSVSPRKHGNSSKQHINREASRRDDRNRDYRERNEKRLDRRTDRRNSRERRHRSRSPRSSAKKDLSNNFNSLQQVSTTSQQLSPESKEKERERERRKKGLPCIKNNYVTICSTTLWLGHLPKSTTEIDISDAFGEYGDINSIDLISARGCAYVCMNRRQDAYKALQNLKNLKLHNSHIKMAWAPGKRSKFLKEFKDFWDKDLGASYIPYDKLTRNTDFELLEDGGMLDEESIPKSLLDLRNEKLNEDKQQQKQQNQQQTNVSNEQSTPSTVEMVQPPIPPSKNQQQPPPQILPIPPPIPPPIVPLGHTLPPFPIGPPIGLPPIPHHLMAPPISLINHPHQNAPPHPILHPPLHQPPQTVDQSNLKLNEDQSNDSLRTPNKQPPNNLFAQPPISLNSQLSLTNSNPWITGVPPPTLQPPFLPKDDQPRNLGPPFFAPPMTNDDSFNNQMFEPNLMMNPMMMQFPHDEQQMQFNDMNKREMFNNNNWRMKKDLRTNNRRFNNSINNSYNNEGNFNDQWNKRKNDNYNNGNKKFKNNQNKNVNQIKKFNINSSKNWNQRRFDQQEENESDQQEMDESRNDTSDVSRNDLSTAESSNGQPVDQSNESIVSDSQNDNVPDNSQDNSQDNFEQSKMLEEAI